MILTPPSGTRLFLCRRLFACWALLLFVCDSGLAAAVTNSLVINEIHFDPPDKTKREEFIELYNRGTNGVDLSGWAFVSGIDFTFPTGTAVGPGKFIVVAADTNAFRAAFGFVPFGPWAGTLSNDGEKIALADASGHVIDEVSFGVGFPWPTATRGTGASMELLHPDLDNNLAGSWRASSSPVALPPPQTFIPVTDTQWHYRKGTSEPAGSAGEWRLLNYIEDASWQVGQTSVGYGDGDDNTVLADMMNNYTTVYLRHDFVVAAGQIPSLLLLNLNIDDGAVIWINGVEVGRVNASVVDPAYNSTAAAAVEPSWQKFVITDTTMLRAGTNMLAIHALNQSLASSDLTVDAELRTPDTSSIDGLPTPGAPNSVLIANASTAPPQIRQVDHSPHQPTNGTVVTISAKVTDPDGVVAVTLSYQIVKPGQYIRKTDAAYQTSWTDIPMDLADTNSTYSAQIPASLNLHRHLVRYRVRAIDTIGHSITVPYADDQSPNFAYFVYDSAPGWRGASHPGTTPALDFPPSLMNSLPIYHLLANGTDVANSQWNGSYDTVRMWGTLVYDGEVYDHIQFHNRGEGSTYNTGKNKWRFHFNTARDFKARDLWGRRYKRDWKILNFNGCASPWAAVNRGMAGLDEAISFRLYELAGVPASKTHYVHFRVIDNAIETNSTSQYDGDLWGLYQAIEQPDGRFLDERDLPDGNVYKIEGGGGDKKNQGPTQPVTGSDWNTFINASRGSQSESWWRTNMDMPKFYSFHAMNRVCGNVDLRQGANHYFYHNPDGHWVAMPWDLDMQFIAETHWPGIIDQNNSLTVPTLALEFRNRCREILDLMCSDASDNGGQIGQLIDEFAQIVNPRGLPLTWADVDECMWNWNPHTTGSNIPSGQTNHKGNFYRTPFTDNRIGGTWIRTLASADHEGFVKFIRDYCTDTDPDGFAPGDGDQRGYGYNYLELEANDAAIPNTPAISYIGSENFPANDLRFQCSDFSDPQGANTFGAMKWRISEISTPGITNYLPGTPRKYELETLWESPQLFVFSNEVTLPISSIRPGSTYRARVRFKDNTGRWSHWSQPVQFLASAPDTGLYTNNLVISEIMYRPGPLTAAETALGYIASDFEYIELKNIGSKVLDLTGVRFTKGVDFDFPSGTALAPGAYLLVAGNAAAFAERYGSNLPVVGSFSPDKLDDAGEQLKLSYGAGIAIRDFVYDNNAPWPDTTGGRSLVLIAPETNLDPANPLNWRPSSAPGGTPGSADAQTFAQWKIEHNISSDGDDSDQDGLSAFLEYATGNDPSASSPETIPAWSVDAANGLSVALKHSLTADDILYRVETSTDLQNWEANSLQPFSRNVTGQSEMLRYSVPIQADPTHLFLRVTIRQR